MCCSTSCRTRTSAQPKASSVLVQASAALLGRLNERRRGTADGDNDGAKSSSEKTSLSTSSITSLSTGDTQGPVGNPPSYDTATSSPGPGCDVPSEAASPAGSTAVFRAVIGDWRTMRVNAASRQAMLRLPTSGTYEQFAHALVDGVHKHQRMMEARGGRFTKPNAGALVVTEVRVEWKDKGCNCWKDEIINQRNWEDMLAMIGQRGWIDSLEVDVERR